MGTWFQKEVGDSVSVVTQVLNLNKQFLLSRGTDMSQMAVFSKSETLSDQTTNILYFTPEAESFAKGISASPCEKPEYSDSFTLLVGDSGILDKHFPEQA